MKKINIYNILTRYVIGAILFIMIGRKFFKHNLSKEVLIISLYISAFLLVVLLILRVLVFYEKRKLNRKISNYNDF